MAYDRPVDRNYHNQASQRGLRVGRRNEYTDSRGQNFGSDEDAYRYGDFSTGGILDEQGELLTDLQNRPHEVDYTQSAGYQQLLNRALGKEHDPMKYSGPSQYARFAQQNIDDRRDQNISDLRGQASGALSGALSQLATRGGLSSGARERLALQSLRGTQAGVQDAHRAAEDATGRVRYQDAQNQQALKERLNQTRDSNIRSLIGIGTGQQDRNVGARERADTTNINRKYDTVRRRHELNYDAFGRQIGADALRELANRRY